MELNGGIMELNRCCRMLEYMMYILFTIKGNSPVKTYLICRNLRCKYSRTSLTGLDSFVWTQGIPRYVPNRES